MFPCLVRGVEETIRFHLRHGTACEFPYGSFRFQLAGLALICLKNETKPGAKRALRELISYPVRVAIKVRREPLLRHLESAEQAHPRIFARDGPQTMTLPIADLNHAHCRPT